MRAKCYCVVLALLPAASSSVVVTMRPLQAPAWWAQLVHTSKSMMSLITLWVILPFPHR